MVSGFLPVAKPRGISSSALVGRMRLLTGQRRIGHSGTLDPLAEGVLVLGINRATALLGLLPTPKIYQAVIRLGTSTDTFDSQGAVTAQAPVPQLTADEVAKALQTFLGPQLQTPPMISALHHQGQRLYHLARKGRQLDLQPRPITITALKLLRFESPEIEIEVACSPGTYIRSLAVDIGRMLNCPSHLNRLLRTWCGGFGLEHCLRLDQGTLDELAQRWPRHLYPPSQILGHLPALIVRGDMQIAVQHGRSIPWPAILEEKDSPIRVLDDQDHLLAIGVVDEGMMRMKRVLVPRPEEAA